MRRFFNWQIIFALILIFLSLVFYFIHYLIFKDLHHIFIYLIGDIAFLFLDVLIVMLVLHRLLVFREKQSILKKLNMVIGTFFIEVGRELIKKFSKFDTNFAEVSKELLITNDWNEKDFARVNKIIDRYESKIKSSKEGLIELKDFLISKRQFLLNLLGNSNLLEHESFTNLLWAVFHIADELSYRIDLTKLPDSDYEHLSGDIKRAYKQLIFQWLNYMKHLSKNYPYLFSLAIRTNPFDANPSVEVK
ncbi:MAG: hypothetical protein NC820_07640 [Candidatus Omnitrophica bacterium]|nr:hypothetical protein [Candidatus Omnitrophota bacterium]